MFEMVDDIRINAEPKKIYEILLDLESYSKWNPFNVEARGQARVDGPLIDVVVHLGKRKMQVKHKILVTAPESVFQWCDTGWFTSFVYGQRTRYLERQIDGSTHYRVVLQLTGPLVRLARWLYQRDLQAGMRAESLALKQLAER